MKLVKKCLIEFNNKYTNHIKRNEVDDDKQLRFTLLDMQKFAKKYHKQKLTLTDVSQQRELLLAYNEEVNQYILDSQYFLDESDVNIFLANNCG